MVTNFMIMWWENLLAVWEVALQFGCKFVEFCFIFSGKEVTASTCPPPSQVWRHPYVYDLAESVWLLKSGCKCTQISWKTESFTKIFILKAFMLIDLYQETQSNNIYNLLREIATEKFFLSWHSFSDQLRQKKTFQRNIQENENNPLLGHSKWLFSSFQKNKSLGLCL